MVPLWWKLERIGGLEEASVSRTPTRPSSVPKASFPSWLGCQLRLVTLPIPSMAGVIIDLKAIFSQLKGYL